MPLRDRRGYFWDIAQASRNIQEFTRDKSLFDYRADIFLRSAVERQFEIIGEALNQALRYYPELSGKITDAERIIAFRNRLIHAYANISDTVVWGIIEDELPRLLAEAEKYLDDENLKTCQHPIQIE